MIDAVSAGFSNGVLWPERGTRATVALAPIARPSRSPTAENLASSTPAITRTGTSRASRRSHSGSWVPVPASRRLDASPAAVLRSRSSRAAARGLSPANRGWASHSSRKAATPDGQEVVGQALVGGAAGLPLVVVVDAAGGPDQHEAGHQVGAHESEVERQPAAHGVADVGRRAPRRRRAGGRPSTGRRRSRRSRRGRARRPATSSWSRARSSAKAPQHRPVWVKPWTSTSRSAGRSTAPLGRSGPTVSACRRPAVGSVTGAA